MTTVTTSNGRAAADTDTAFPVDSFRDAAKHLRRPFTPQAVKFKPQTILGDGKGVLVVAYIDARLVIERLNLVCPHLWHDEYRAVGDGLMWCDLTIDGITRRDIGEGKGKALVSDALKRAAVHFGVGVSLYAIPQQRIWVDQGNKKFISVWKKGHKNEARIEPNGTTHLRNVYAHWLDNVGREAFGEPLNHGDVEDHQGDPDADPPANVDPGTGEVVEPPKPITIANAKALVDTAFDLGVQDKLQLAAAHVRGDDVGECSTKGAATEALRKLTVPQADKLATWLEKKAAERVEPDADGGESHGD